MIDNMCHRKRNDYKIDMAIDTFWHESIVHKIGKVLIKCIKLLQRCKYDDKVKFLAQ